jgi:hypothetical protein
MTLAQTILNRIQEKKEKINSSDSKLGDKKIADELKNTKYVVGYGFNYYPTVIIYESPKEVTLRWAETTTKKPKESDLNFGVTFLKDSRMSLGRSYQNYKLFM